MRYWKILLAIIIFGIVFNTQSKNVLAAYSSYEACMLDIGNANAFYIPTFSQACQKCIDEPTFRRGTIWFNGSATSHYDAGVSAYNQMSVNVWLHGSYNQCGSTLTNAAGMAATHIRFYRPGTSELATYILQPADTLTLNRGNISTASAYKWSSPGAIGPFFVNFLDPNFVIDSEYYDDMTAFGGSATTSGYILHVDIFRCPAGSAPSSTSCYTDPSIIVLYRDKIVPIICPEGQIINTATNTCCDDKDNDGVCDPCTGPHCGDCTDDSCCPAGQVYDATAGSCVPKVQPVQDMCANWKSQTRANNANSKEGETSIIAAAKNNGLKSPDWVLSIANYSTGDADNDNKPIYAKPGDKIDFQNCYYGGEQKTANTTATYSDDDNSCNSQPVNKAMKNIYDFAHGLDIYSENFGENDDENHYENYDYSAGDDKTKSYKNSYNINPFDVLDNYVYEYSESNGIAWAKVYDPETHRWVCKATCSCVAPQCDCGYSKLYNGLELANSASSGCVNELEQTPVAAAFSLSGLIEDADIKLTYLGGDGLQPGEDPHDDDWCDCDDGCYDRVKKCCSGDDAYEESYDCKQNFTYHSHTVIPSDADDSDIMAQIAITVPYNFINTAAVSLGETSSSIAYAGEDMKINTTVKVNTRKNNTTNGTYATIEEDSDVRIYTYSSTQNTGNEKRGVGDYGLDICSQLPYNRGNCTNVNDYGGELNETASMGGATYDHADLFGSDNTYNIYDVPAGEYFCAVVAIFPYTTHGDTDIDMFSYDHQWYISAPSCKVVNKKPSFQVWGGNVYSSGNIKTKYAAKNVVAHNRVPYTAQNRSNKTIFGSWGEFGVIPNAGNDFLSSSAATGYTANSGGNLISTPGGNKTGTSGIYCKNSPLTIMNKGCSGNSVPEKANIMSDTSSKTEIYNSLAVPAQTTPARAAGTWLNLSDANNYSILDGNPSMRYTYVRGDAYVRASQVMPTGVTHVVYATGNIIIGPNLQYSEGPYTDLSQVPQYVFYASSDIDIEHNVSRVDGWLIAEKTVNTCTSGTTLIGVNDARAAVQLKINGAVVAEKINLGRTYGASMGDYSEIPAEIINLNITHFLWSSSNTSSTPSLRTVYTRELAPRY